MAIQLQLRQGTTTEHNTFTGAVGEVTVDTTKDVPVVHDGVTVGGHPVAARANADGTISLIKKDGTSAGTINANGLFNNTLTSTSTTQALTAAQGKFLNDQSFGIEQTWQDLTSSRASGVTYTNSTARPVLVSISLSDTYSQSPTVSIYVGGFLILTNKYDDGQNFGSFSHSFIVPSGSTYSISSPLSTIQTWSELR